jgi:HlyD family secretion protein
MITHTTNRPSGRVKPAGRVHRILAVMMLAASAALAGWFLLGEVVWAGAPPGKGGPMQPPPTRVVIAKVENRQIDIGQTFVGTVIPLRQSTVGSTVEGRVVEFSVEAGDPVKAGQVLARIRTEQLQIDLTIADNELALRKQALSEQQVTLPEDVRQAEARMLAAEALRDFAQSRLRRSQSLIERRAISQEELQDQQSAFDAAQQKAVESRAAWVALRDSQQQKLEQAQLKVTEQEQTIARLKDDLSEHSIVAPFAGYVTAEHTEVGQWMAKGAPVVDLVEVDQVEVEAAVPEGLIQQVQRGMIGRVEFDAYPSQSWKAPVTAIVPSADPRSRSFPVRLRLDNPADSSDVLFKPGMFARVTLAAGARAATLLVPKDAVLPGHDQTPPVIYVVDRLPEAATGGGPPEMQPNATARCLPVTLGAEVDDLIEVRNEALKPGDVVAVEGNERISASGYPYRLLVINADLLPPK